MRMAWSSPRWRWSLLVAVLSDSLNMALTFIAPLQWGVDAATAIILLVVLGFRWWLLGVLVIEAIPAVQLFPAWTLVVLALAASEENYSEPK